MTDVELLQQAKERLQAGESSFLIAEDLDLPIVVVEDMRKTLVNNIKSQAVDNRIALRQSIRNKIPKALQKAVDIMDMDFNELELTGANDRSEGTAKDHIAFLKLQIDAAKAVLSLANQAVGEDFLNLYTEKEEKKKENFKVRFESEVLPDGRIKLSSSTEALNLDKEEETK
jgi:hypothetical protein